MESATKCEVTHERLCWQCNGVDFSFECTDELAPPQGLIGQERALNALQFGLEVDKRGYNLFVTGLTGTGKASAIKRYLQAIITRAGGVQYPVYDWCCVHNFPDPDTPRMLRLPPWGGKALHRGLEELLKSIQEEIPKVFSGNEYTSQRKDVEESGRAEYQRRLQELERKIRGENFGLQLSPAGMNLFPLNEEGKPYPPEDFMSLGEDERTVVEERRGRLLLLVQETMEHLRSVEKESQDKVKALDRAVGELRLTDLFKGLVREHGQSLEVIEYLNDLKEYSLSNLNVFTAEATQPQPRWSRAHHYPARLSATPCYPSMPTCWWTTRPRRPLRSSSSPTPPGETFSAGSNGAPSWGPITAIIQC